MTIAITVIVTLTLRYVYGRVKEQIKINKAAKQAGLEWKIKQIVDEKIKSIITD